jgi:hypothetical protein
MTAPESTTVVPAPSPSAPTAPPAASVVTVEHISSLHRHLDELKTWVGEKFKEIVALVEKAAPVVETAAAAVAPMLGAAGAPIVAAVEKVVRVAADVVTCCGHVHLGTCATNCPVCSKPA